MGSRIARLLMLSVGLLVFQAPLLALGQGAPPGALSTPGDPSAGARLFRGEMRLANGGTPCIACHSAGGAGGTLGPDLTKVFQRYGGARNLDAVLAQIAFPTMQPVFAGRPLQPRERADIIAYLGEVSQTSPATAPPQGTRFLLFGFLYALLATVLARVLWRSRLTGVRRALVSRSAR